MGCRPRVPYGHFVAVILFVAIVNTLLCSTAILSDGGRAHADVTDVTLARATDARNVGSSGRATGTATATGTAIAVSGDSGTIQLAQLEDQFENVARTLAPAVVAISASLTNVDSDEALRSESLNGDKLGAILNRTTRTVGTGFFIDPEGYILTNEHVVAEAGQIWVTTDDRKVYPAIVIGSDPRSDLAVLKIPARQTPTVTFSDPGAAHRGMWTIALGNPYGLAELGEMSMSVGIVSAVDRSLPKLSSKENRLYSGLLQTTAEINPGNSGGPLFNLKGEVIGVNTAVILPQKQTNGIGFAIPVSDDLLAKVGALKQGHEIVYGYLGVLVSNPTARERRNAGIDGDLGVIIDSVEQGSPAQGTLKVGDVVVDVAGRPVRDSDQFVREIGELPVDRPTPVAIRRDGKSMYVDVVTRKRQLPQVAVTRETQRFRWRGMLLGPIPANWDVNGKRPENGVMVFGIDPTSPAVKDGIQAGAVITAIGGRTIADVIELQRIVNEIPPEQWTIQILGMPGGAMMADGK